MNIEENVLHYFRQLPEEQRQEVVLGVSGGVDSMVLFHILHKHHFKIHVVHVNYHLRGEASDLDAQLVQDICSERKIPCHVFSEDLTGLHSGIQEKARSIRRKLFIKIAQSYGISGIVLAQHLNDQQETLIFNLFRGSGLSGLVNMLKKHQVFLRPMLDIGKNEILEYAKIHQIEYRQDESNLKNQYARNLIRNELLPAFKNLFTDYEKRLSYSSHRLCHQYELYQSLIKNSVESIQKKKEYYTELDMNLFSSKDHLPLLLFEYYQYLEFTLVQFQDLLINDSNETKKAQASQHTFFRKGKKLYLVENKYLDSPSPIKVEEHDQQISWGPYQIQLTTIPTDALIEASGSLNDQSISFIDKQKIQYPITIKSYEPGDRIRPKQMNHGSKKISDLLTDKKMEPFRKSIFPIIYSDDQAIVIPGIAIDRNYMIGSKTTEILKITIE